MIMLESVISDQATAKRISELMLRMSDELNESVRMVLDNCPADEFFKYRRTIGGVMAELLEVLNPLYSIHPALKPPGFE